MTFSRALSAVVLLAGVALALFGLLLDFMWPSSNPGINLPQLLIVAAGVALAFAGIRLHRSDYPAKTWAKGVVVALCTLLTVEIMLTMLAFPTYFRSDLPEFAGKVLDWWRCDASSCYYDYARTIQACESGAETGRHCAINRAGYRDADEFISLKTDVPRRILMLGDSFTHGFSADLGKSYVETFESSMPDALVWNTAITGNGSNGALAAFHNFAPSLKPQLTILGFYMNDFVDNQFPADSWIHIELEDGLRRYVRRYSLDRLGNAIKLDLDVALYYHSRAKSAPKSGMEAVVASSRLGTLLLRFFDFMGESLAGAPFQRQQALTHDYLLQLREAAAAQGSSLLIVLIPTRGDLVNPGKEFVAAQAIFTSLDIPYLNTAHVLRVEDYNPTSMDPHWNNSGHGKVGELLAQCIADFFAAGSLSACDQVVIPQH